jgi:hypothetical protein
MPARGSPCTLLLLFSTLGGLSRLAGAFSWRYPLLGGKPPTLADRGGGAREKGAGRPWSPYQQRLRAVVGASTPSSALGLRPVLVVWGRLGPMSRWGEQGAKKWDETPSRSCGRPRLLLSLLLDSSLLIGLSSSRGSKLPPSPCVASCVSAELSRPPTPARPALRSGRALLPLLR